MLTGIFFRSGDINDVFEVCYFLQMCSTPTEIVINERGYNCRDRKLLIRSRTNELERQKLVCFPFFRNKHTKQKVSTSQQFSGLFWRLKRFLGNRAPCWMLTSGKKSSVRAVVHPFEMRIPCGVRYTGLDSHPGRCTFDLRAHSVFVSKYTI